MTSSLIIKRLFAFASTLLSQTVALPSNCLVGWPAILGSSTQDGNTDVQVWSETPFTDTYLIGGNSDSADFTENPMCATNGKGCAYLANWNKISQEFTQKWIFTKPTTIKDIKFGSLDVK